MKNVQVIDAAANATFSVFQMTDDEFRAVFVSDGQDIEFAEDLYERLGDGPADALLAAVWTRPVRKTEIAGLHGTLFYGFVERRAHYPETKRERDFDARSLNPHQLALYGR